MLSNNPRIDKFLLIFSDDFFIPEIINKYDQILKQLNYPLLSIKDMIKESIKNVETPEFAYTPIEQIVQDGNYSGFPDAKVSPMSEQQLSESKTIDVTFRHSDGFLTYWCLLEHFYARYAMGPNNKRGPFSSLILQTYSQKGFPSARIYYEQMLFKKIPAILFDYSSPDRNILEFTCSFHYNTFSTSIMLPELNIIK